MSSIDIRRFVDVNILPHELSTVNAARDTVVLFSTEVSENFDKTYKSYSEYNADETVKDLTNTTAYAKVYFDNGGNKLRIIKIVSTDTLNDEIMKLDNNYIVVALASADNYSIMQSVATTRESNAKVYGINQKILLARTNQLTNLIVAKNFGVKYSTVIGAEMTIAAYLSNINVYGNDSVQDYAYTKEVIEAEPADDDILGNVLENNLNVDMLLANAVRNLGGNLTNGLDIVNQYVLIILHQTVTERILNLLSQKIKGSAGLSALYGAISQELGRYVSSGYLTTDKVWKDRTLDIMYNNKNYKIIEQGTALPLGYKVVILPLTSLTDDDVAQRKTPPIYVILADSYSIRKVTINGEVI